MYLLLYLICIISCKIKVYHYLLLAHEGCRFYQVLVDKIYEEENGILKLLNLLVTDFNRDKSFELSPFSDKEGICPTVHVGL